MYNFQIGPINYILVQLGLFTEWTAPQCLGGTALTLPAVAAFETWWGWATTPCSSWPRYPRSPKT